MKDHQRVLIRKDTSWKDVTDRYVVIYGAGQGCIDIMSEFQLPNVRYVIDSNEKKYGEQIILLDQIYFVQSPKILLELQQEEYYLVISSERYANEIKKSIENFVDIEKLTICINRDEISFLYESVEDLFLYDPRIKKSLVNTNWSSKTKQLISLFLSVSGKVFPNKTIDHFISIENGRNRVVFCFGINEKLYIFSIPALFCELNKALLPHNPEERKIRYQFRKKYHIGNELTIYEDEAGVMIQLFANSMIDFEEERNVQYLLRKCYELHQLEFKIKVVHDFLKEIYQAALTNLKRVAPWEYNRAKELSIQSEQLFCEMEKMKIKQKICHGDVSCANAVIWKNSLYLIDWEHMSMSDPLYDVCRFLYNIGTKNRYVENLSYVKVSEKIYDGLNRNLEFYYGRNCTDEEYYHACLVMRIIECEEALFSGFYMGHIEDERYEDLMGRLIKGVSI